MMLTHVCPLCRIKHELAQTPEPNQLCPQCKLERANLIVLREDYQARLRNINALLERIDEAMKHG